MQAVFKGQRQSPLTIIVDVITHSISHDKIPVSLYFSETRRKIVSQERRGENISDK